MQFRKKIFGGIAAILAASTLTIFVSYVLLAVYGIYIIRKNNSRDNA